MVYYEEIKISGSIDMIFENPDGTIQIYDWKRCVEIQFENYYNQRSTTGCISHLPDTNYWHYALQLNTYRAILEEKYGVKVSQLYLVRLHPDIEEKTYELLEVPILEKEMKDLFEERKKEVKTT
jgi:ATP-dependent exoDNAse (exonuclease V) beta subunit